MEGFVFVIENYKVLLNGILSDKDFHIFFVGKRSAVKQMVFLL